MAYVKEILQELVESQRNNEQNYNAKDLCRRRMVQGVALSMSTKLAWKYRNYVGRV